MIRKGCIKTIMLVVFTTTMFVNAQETNADISHQANEDAFQEFFYESLKQKGIENYDKAITALLECKLLEPENEVIDYELGLNYMYQHKYVEAQPYFEKAISKDAANKWYLDALLDCYKNQQNIEKAIEVASTLAEQNSNYKIVLVDLYIENKDYEKAMGLLDEMEAQGISRSEVVQRKSKVVMLNNINALADNYTAAESKSVSINNPIEDYKKQILKQKQRTDFNEMLIVSSEALDNYPTQPEFYYLKGVALNKLQKFEMAKNVLEEGLGYLLDNKQLENNIYNELVFAYNGLNNVEKAKEYQQKINSNN